MRIPFLRGLLLGCAILAAAPPLALAYPILDPDGGAKASAGYPSFGADIAVSVTSTATTSGLAAMNPGLYVITCTQDVHVDQGATGVVATTSERFIPAKSPYPLKVTGVSDTYLSIIRNASDGTCYVSKDTY